MVCKVLCDLDLAYGFRLLFYFSFSLAILLYEQFPRTNSVRSPVVMRFDVHPSLSEISFSEDLACLPHKHKTFLMVICQILVIH